MVQVEIKQQPREQVVYHLSCNCTIRDELRLPLRLLECREKHGFQLVRAWHKENKKDCPFCNQTISLDPNIIFEPSETFASFGGEDKR